MAKIEHDAWSGIFRVFTVLCLILLLLARQTGDGEAQGVYESLTLWAVPAIFLCWGMTALEDRSSLGENLLTLVLPCFALLVFWGALYAIVAHLLRGGALTLAGVLGALKSAAMGNTHFHLWLIYPLLGLYLVTPVLGRFVTSASRGEVVYLMALCLVFASLLPVGAALWPEHVLVRLLERLQVHLVLGWAGYFVAGWYFKHYVISRISEYILYILGVLGLAVTLLAPRLPGGSGVWRGYTAPGVALTAIALCVLFRYVLGISDERSRRSAVNALGEYAFGIYLVHQLWVLVMDWLGIPLLPFAPVLALPVMALILFLLSAPVAWLVYIIPGAGKWLL